MKTTSSPVSAGKVTVTDTAGYVHQFHRHRRTRHRHRTHRRRVPGSTDSEVDHVDPDRVDTSAASHLRKPIRCLTPGARTPIKASAPGVPDRRLRHPTPGTLCKITYPDNTTTDLLYQALTSGERVAVTSRGPRRRDLRHRLHQRQPQRLHRAHDLHVPRPVRQRPHRLHPLRCHLIDRLPDPRHLRHQRTRPHCHRTKSDHGSDRATESNRPIQRRRRCHRQRNLGTPRRSRQPCLGRRTGTAKCSSTTPPGSNSTSKPSTPQPHNSHSPKPAGTPPWTAPK